MVTLPSEGDRIAHIVSSTEMINVAFGTTNDCNSWPIEFIPEEQSDMAIVSIKESEWSWNEPQIPGNEQIFVPFELIEDNEKAAFEIYDSWIAVHSLRIGKETYIPNEDLRPCPHPPEHIDTVVVNDGVGVGISTIGSLNKNSGEEVQICKQCKTLF